MDVLHNDDRHSNTSWQENGPCGQRNLAYGRITHSGAIRAALGMFYFLVLAGIFTRYVLVVLQKDQLSGVYNQLKDRYDNLSASYNQSQQQDKRPEPRCPRGWRRLGVMCYYKSSEWGRRRCKLRGGELLLLNSSQSWVQMLLWHEAFEQEVDQLFS